MIADFFEQIDTAEKAYWLGFVVADGNVNAQGSQLRFNQKGSDAPHLEKLITALDSHAGVRMTKVNGHDVARLWICSKSLVADLANLGIHPRKSMSQKMPDIDEIWHPHFWRGVMDGDGSLGFWRNKHGKRYPTISLNGNREIVHEFKAFLERHEIYRGSISRHSSILKFKCTGSSGPPMIVSLLKYDALPSLDRKALIARSFY